MVTFMSRFSSRFRLKVLYIKEPLIILLSYHFINYIAKVGLFPITTEQHEIVTIIKYK